MMKKNNITTFKLVYLTAYFADALFSVFNILYLKSINLSDSKISIIMFLIPFSGILGNYFYSFFCKSFPININLLKIISFLEGITIIFFSFINNFYFLSIITFVICFNNSSYFKILDGTSVLTLNKYNKIFSTLRVFGSIGYFIALLVFAFLFKYINFNLVFIFSSFFFLITFILLFLIDKEDYLLRDKIVINEENKFIEEKLSRNKNFYIYLIFSMLTLGSLSISYSIYPLCLKERNVGEDLYSLFFAFTVAFETIIFFIILLFKKKKNLDFYYLVSGIILRMIGYSFLFIFKDIYLTMFLLIIFQGASSALILSSEVKILNSIVGDKLISKALEISGCLTSFYLAIGNFLVLNYHKYLSYNEYFLILSIIETFGLLFIIYLFYKYKKIVK